LNEITLVHLCI